MQWASQLFGMGLLDPELEKRLSEAQRRQMGGSSLMDAGLAMLANSGYSQTPRTLGEIVGRGMMAGRQSYAAQADGMRGQLQAQAQKEAEAQQRAQILQGLDPELQRFAAGLSLPQLMDVAKTAAGEKSKAMNREPATSSYFKAATDMGLKPGTPEHAQMVQRLATQSKAPVVNVNTGGQGFQVGPISDDEAVALGLRTDRRWQRDKNGLIKEITGSGPTKGEEATAGKGPQAANAGMIMEQMQQSLDSGLTTGPWNELFGIPVGRWSSQEKEQFEALKEQLSVQVRALFRIPGEGPLSDQEQRQYGMTLPSLDKRPETNVQLISNLQAMLGNMMGAGPQIIPGSSAAQGPVRIIRRVDR